jgi:1,4-dihydroxy-2-naphthoate octaprenyltransferase
VNLREFLRLIRIPSLSATVIPLAAGGAAAVKSYGNLNAALWLDMFVAALLMQIAANILNEHGDYVNRVDRSPSHGFAGSIVRGVATPHEILGFAIAIDAAALLLAIPLVAARGYPILLAGLFGALVSIVYSEGPHPLSKTPFGELAVGATMGLVEISAAQFVAAGKVSSFALLLSAPLSLLVASILIANNTRDIEKDRAGGRKTIEVAIGLPLSAFLFYCVVFLSYALLVVLFALTGVRGILLPFTSLPLALLLSLRLERSGWRLGVEYSSAIYLVFGLLLVAGVLA